MNTSISNDKKKFEIAVLYGGNSAEREISLKTGKAVIEALQSKGHQVKPIDPKETALDYYDWSEIDIAVICLHGQFGEDGQVQRILEDARVCYTGCDASVSRIAFSKSVSKKIFLKNNIPTPAFNSIHETATASEINLSAEQIGFPLIIKPDTQGSSIGVSLVNNKEELPQALSQAFHFDENIIMEQAVLGSEWTMGFINDEPLPLIRITHEKNLFDFDAKYTEEATGYTFEFTETSDVIKRIQNAGQSVVDVLKTKGFTRVDIRLDKLNNPYVLEINTVPGMTEQSLIPKAALQAGISFVDLCHNDVLSSWEQFSKKTNVVLGTTTK